MASPVTSPLAANPVDSLHEATEAIQQVLYIGIPGEPIYRYRDGVDQPCGSVLSARHDLAMLGTLDEGRCDDDGCRCQLAVAILADFLGDSDRLLRLYHAFARVSRPRTPVDALWLLNEADVFSLVEKAEREIGLTWDEEAGVYQEESSIFVFGY